MLRGAAVLASFLGFGAVAFTAGIIAKVLFFVFLALFLFTLSAGLRRQPGDCPRCEVSAPPYQLT